MIGHDAAARGQVYAAHFLWQAGTKGQRIMPQGRRLCLTHAVTHRLFCPALLRAVAIQNVLVVGVKEKNFKENTHGAAQQLQVSDPR